MPAWVRACRAEDVREGRGVAVDLDGLRVAVFRDRGDFRAIQSRCPHAGGSLGSGWIEGGAVVCPLHRWRFRLSDGRREDAAGESVHAFPCEVRGEDVWVEV